MGGKLPSLGLNTDDRQRSTWKALRDGLFLPPPRQSGFAIQRLDALLIRMGKLALSHLSIVGHDAGDS